MSNLGNEYPRPKGNSPLAHWFHNTVGLDGGRVQFRLRGNNLHILCENTSSPDQTATLMRLLPALQQVDLNTLIPPGQPKIYQVFLYGRRFGQNRPDWTAPIDLNQLDHHLEQLQHLEAGLSEFAQPPVLVSAGSPVAIAESAPANLPPEPPVRPAPPPIALSSSALQLSNRTLAKQGKTEAIARTLSEILSSLGVAVQVSVKTSSYPGQTPNAPDLTPKRLWVNCEAPYSPEPSLIAEPIAQKLRDLELENFRDAVVWIQVAGEAEPDWLLRVDLTPPGEMLREWARWGDVGAITRLLNRTLDDVKARISTASLRDETLHLFCCPAEESIEGTTTVSPLQADVVQLVAPLLETLGPQGILAAALYGQSAAQQVPTWVEWLHLPASQHPALAEPPLALAKQGDLGAIAFLLNRLLNPDLQKQLATGGIRIQISHKQDLLHVMTDAPLCPDQKQVGTAVVRFLKELQLPHVGGVRVYGRRSGQKRPLWSYGSDFTSRDRLVPEPEPEFAATDAYVGDLIAPAGELALRPDLTTTDLHTAWTRFCDRLYHGIQQALIRSHLFIPSPETQDLSPAPESEPTDYRALKLAAVWGAAGVLLAVQADWALGRWLQGDRAPATQVSASASASTLPASPTPAAPALTEPELPDLQLSHSGKENPGTFNETGFTKSPAATPAAGTASTSPTRLPFTPTDPQSQSRTAEILAAGSPYPTFNSRQLDEKLALYYQRLKQSGPPDVLIIGSSRALRGVDPVALQRSLASLGYEEVTVFNFGINGATAQVAQLVLQQILKADQMPKLLIWADGARAFNSGTVDVTYNGIAVSQGYRALREGTLERPDVASAEDAEAIAAADAEKPENIGTSLKNSYLAIDRWLSDRLGQVSTVYRERDRLRGLMQERFTGLGDAADASTDGAAVPSASADSTQSLSEAGRDMVDFDGFLPLSLRFNPATYFQEYARVEGRYDSDYEDFRVEGMQSEAFKNLLQFTRARKIPLVFVNLPLTDEYLDPVRLEHEQTFKQYMLQESLNQPGFIFRDLGEIWLTQYDYFSDPSHLNRYGAYELSRRIAQDPMIPWADVNRKD